MGRKVKHYITREELNTDWCFRGVVAGKAAFFLTEDEFNKYIIEKDKRDRIKNVFDSKWKDIIPKYFHGTLYSRMNKSFNDWYELYPPEYIEEQLEKVSNIERYMSNIDFSNGYGMGSYFIKAFTNILEKDIMGYVKKAKQAETKIYKTDDDLMILTNSSTKRTEDLNSIDEWI